MDRRVLPLLIALACAPGAAAAQPTDEPSRETRAEQLFRAATPLVDAGRYAEACAKLEESERLDPALGTEFNLGVCYERSGKLAAALRVFRQVAVAAQAAGKSERARAARERASALEPRVPVVEAPRADLEAPPAKSETPIAPAATPAPFAPATTAKRAEYAPSYGWDTRRWAGAGTFVAGVVGVAAGAWLGGVALSRRSDLSSTCPAYPTCAPDRIGAARDLDDAGRSAALGSTIALASGGVALAVGAVLFLTSPTTSRPAPSMASRSASLRVTPTLGGAVLEGRW